MAYLFVMLRWARALGVPLSSHMVGYFERVLERKAVRQALAEEALLEAPAVVAAAAPVVPA